MSGEAGKVIEVLRGAVAQLSVDEIDDAIADRRADLVLMEERRSAAEKDLRVLEQLKVLKIIEAAEVLAALDGEHAPRAADPTGRQRAILEVARAAGRPVSPQDVHEVLESGGESMRLSAVQNMMGRMAKRGYLSRVDGRRATYVPGAGGAMEN